MSLAHHSLVAWQRADDLFIRLHLISRERFPAYERFELGRQMRRAAFSVAANVHVALRLGYISEGVAKELEVQVKEVGATHVPPLGLPALPDPRAPLGRPLSG